MCYWPICLCSPRRYLKFDLSIGLAATSIGTLVRAVLTPLVGSLSDRIGRKPIVQSVNIAFFVFAIVSAEAGRRLADHIVETTAARFCSRSIRRDDLDQI